MSKNHILIIEDDEDIQQLVSFNLIKAGFNVSCANNGEDGLERLEEEIINGLENGADDYITKPFSPKVLVARLKSVLRRSNKTDSKNTDRQDEVIAINDIKIIPGRHEVLVKGHEIKLTSTEFAILVLLSKKPGWVYSRQQIIDAIRGHDYLVTPRMIDVQVFSLRKKLQNAGGNIETVRGIGYRCKAE